MIVEEQITDTGFRVLEHCYLCGSKMAERAAAAAAEAAAEEAAAEEAAAEAAAEGAPDIRGPGGADCWVNGTVKCC